MENQYVKIKYSKIHGNGGFAKRKIKKGRRIIEYIGTKVTKKQAEKISGKVGIFLFEIDDKWDIDGSVPENTARFINHSCDPNCTFDIIKGRIWIKSKQDIKKGEELSYNYGFDVKDYKKSPCRCGAKNCMGYILDKDHWKKIKKIENLKKKDITQAAKVYNKGLSMEIPKGKATIKETKNLLSKVKCFVYKEKNVIIGLVSYKEKIDGIELDFICSLKKRKGIASKLMTNIINKKKPIYSSVSSIDKITLKFYKKLGFKKYGSFKSKSGTKIYKIKLETKK